MKILLLISLLITSCIKTDSHVYNKLPCYVVNYELLDNNSGFSNPYSTLQFYVPCVTVVESSKKSMVCFHDSELFYYYQEKVLEPQYPSIKECKQ